MSTFKVGFSRPRKFWAPFSWLIRLFDQTPYSHVYVRFYSSKYDRWLVYQASHTFVNFYGMPAFDEEALTIREFDIDVSDDARTKVIQFAIDNAGVQYDIKTVFGIAIVRIAAMFGHTMTNPLGNGRGYFCSELVGSILLELGLADGVDLSTLTPRGIYERLDA